MVALVPRRYEDSTGLAEARAIVQREAVPSLSVLLLSDLDNSGFDSSALLEEVTAYERNGLTLRVVPLFPAEEDRDFFERVVGEDAMLDRAELVRKTSVRESLTLVGSSPWALAILVRASSVSSPSTSGSAHGSRGGGRRERARVAPAGRGRGGCGCARRGVPRCSWRSRRTSSGWDRTMRDDDIAYAAHADASWQPNTLLPAGITRTALDLEDDVEFRGAVDQFWKSEPRAPLQVFTDVTRRTAAERRLARLIETEERADRRSALATLRGAFLLEEARNSPVQRHVFLRRAIEQFRRAAELDPGNADADIRPRARAQAAP